MKTNWQTKKLGEICAVFADGDWIEKKDQSKQGIRLIQTGNVGNGVFKDREEKARYISEKTFKCLRCTEIFPSDCLISRLPDPVGRACIIPKTKSRMITAVDCTIIRFKKDILPQWFVNYSLSQNYQNQVNKEVGGSTRQRISRSNLALINIPVPPLLEQKRIVKIMDEAFEKIERAKENAEKNLKNSKELFESYLQNIFVNPGKNWKEITLGEVVKTTQGVQIVKSLQIKNPRIGFKRYLYISDFNHEKNLKYVEDKYPTKIVTKNDLIVVNTGASAGNIFRGIDGVLSNNLFKVSFDDKILDGDFIYYFVTSDIFKKFQAKIVRGTANPHMGHENFNMTPIFLPSFLEQKAIVKKLDALSEETKKLEGIYKQKLADLEELKKSVLNKAFNGEL